MGDMSRRPKTAKINLGRNRHVLNYKAAITSRAILNTRQEAQLLLGWPTVLPIADDLSKMLIYRDS